jgi:tetratricopeptide (TPR) repeat protein
MMRAEIRLLAVAICLAIAIHSLPAQGFAFRSSNSIAQASAPQPGGGTDVLRLNAEGKFEEARRLGMARVIAAKDDTDAFVGLAWSLVALGRYADAETWATRGYELRKDPRLAEAIGEAAYFLGKNELSLIRLQEYLGAFPEGSKAGTAYYFCGEIYIRQSRFMHADIALTAALRYNPENPAWWARLGWARESSGKTLQALKAFEKALALDSRQADAMAGRARISARLRE